MRLSETGRKLGRWLAVILWMGIIFWLSSQRDLPHHPQGVADVIIKKTAHVAEYGVLAGLIWWAWPEAGEQGRQRGLLRALVLSALYALSDEVHQFFVPGRNAQWLDVGFDVAGAFMALLLLSNLVGRREVQ